MNPCCRTSAHPLEVDIVADTIFSILLRETKDYRTILPFRGVCHKWNDTIVRLATKAAKPEHSFQIPLRYCHTTPKYIVQSDAIKRAKESLTNAVATLSGTATPIPFNTLLIDRDFYLGSCVMSELTQFLEVHGKSIQHLKINIRREKFPDRFVNYVRDCPEIVSIESLCAIFRSVLNLESLYFCVRFQHYGDYWVPSSLPDRLFPATSEFPQMDKLTRITIQEPYHVTYVPQFVRDILSLAPNLNDLYILPTIQLETFTSLLGSLEGLQGSLTSLGVSNDDAAGGGFHETCFRDIRGFTNLSRLQIDYIGSLGYEDHLSSLFNVLNATLVTLTLGMGDRNKDGLPRYMKTYYRDMQCDTSVTFPPVMKTLRKLEMNLSAFKLTKVVCYQTQFPVLDDLTFTYDEKRESNPERIRYNLMALLPGVTGKSLTLKEFSLKRPLLVVGGVEDEQIIQRVRTTFPTAIHSFGN